MMVVSMKEEPYHKKGVMALIVGVLILWGMIAGAAASGLMSPPRFFVQPPGY